MSFYDEIASGYDELHGSEQLEKYRALLALGLIGPEETILDLGHGSGLIARVFVNPILGIDSSEALLVRSPCETRVLDFSRLPLPFDDASFDWVVSFTALHHASDPAGLLADARRIARRGIAITVLRSLPSFGRLEALFEGWDRHRAGADELFVLARDAACGSVGSRGVRR